MTSGKSLGQLSGDLRISDVSGGNSEVSATVPAGEHITVTLDSMKSTVYLDGNGAARLILDGMKSKVVVGPSVTITEQVTNGMMSEVTRRDDGDVPSFGESATGRTGELSTSTDNSTDSSRDNAHISDQTAVTVSNRNVNVNVSNSGDVSETLSDLIDESTDLPPEVQTEVAATVKQLSAGQSNQTQDMSISPEYVSTVAELIEIQVRQSPKASECSKHLKELQDILRESELRGQIYEEILETLSSLIARVDNERLSDELDDTRVRQIENVTHRIKKLVQRQT